MCVRTRLERNYLCYLNGKRRSRAHTKAIIRAFPASYHTQLNTPFPRREGGRMQLVLSRSVSEDEPSCQTFIGPTTHSHAIHHTQQKKMYDDVHGTSSVSMQTLTAISAHSIMPVKVTDPPRIFVLPSSSRAFISLQPWKTQSCCCWATCCCGVLAADPGTPAIEKATAKIHWMSFIVDLERTCTLPRVVYLGCVKTRITSDRYRPPWTERVCTRCNPSAPADAGERGGTIRREWHQNVSAGTFLVGESVGGLSRRYEDIS